MATKMKRGALIVIIIGGAIAGGAGAGIALWNKPHAKVENAQGIPVTATKLVQDYNTNEAEANKLYLDKAVEVTGTITKIERNQDSALVVTLAGANEDMSVLCQMREGNPHLSQGESTTLKGFCSGGDMFGVVLHDCIVK